MECEDKENLRICWDLVNAVTILGEIKTARFLMADSIWSDPGYGIMGFSYTVGDETLDMQIVSDSEGNDVYVLTIYHSESPRRET